MDFQVRRSVGQGEELGFDGWEVVGGEVADVDCTRIGEGECVGCGAAYTEGTGAACYDADAVF